MLNIGCHLSAAKGFLNMGKETTEINGNTFQFFTRNPRGSQAKEIDLNDIESFQKYANEYDFLPPLAHAPYTLNAAGADQKTREFAEMVFTDDLKRLAYLPGVMYNFHPGSHVGQGTVQGIAHISTILNRVIRPDQNNIILLETMSGKGSEIGSRFEELKAIIDSVNHADKLGVCLDTCHVFAAGYDIVHQLDNVIETFDKIIGLNRLKAIHLNDSLMPFNSHKDRHAPIGYGEIGLKALTAVINHPALRSLPFYLETPHEKLNEYAEEIRLLKDLYQS
ncbi:MAG: deoxyribonuclease IV [Alphaproteobacteria bacterium]|nr:deoxyribonuclease IV [Alphaproteobacteria bacterium]